MQHEVRKSVRDLRGSDHPLSEIGAPYRWKPGQSGNVQGLGVIKPIRDALLEVFSDPKKAKEIASILYRKGKTGSMPHIEFIADRLDGPLPRIITATFTHEMSETERTEARDIVQRIQALDSECEEPIEAEIVPTDQDEKT